MREIKIVGVVGAGQMGAGIAQVVATAGYKTILWDAAPQAIERGLAGIDARLAKATEKGTLSEQDRAATRSRLSAAKAITDFASCDLVIEAVIEQFEAKAALFKQLDQVLPKGALLVSNTSSISITRLAAVTSRPELVLGVHFMNPVPVMKLVELIRGLQTTDESYTTLQKFCASIQKTTVLAIDAPGFVVNRILCPMLNEAIFLVHRNEVRNEPTDGPPYPR